MDHGLIAALGLDGFHFQSFRTAVRSSVRCSVALLVLEPTVLNWRPFCLCLAWPFV